MATSREQLRALLDLVGSLQDEAERRASARVLMRVQLDIVPAGPGQPARTEPALLENISRDGLCVTVQQRLAVGDRFTVRLPDDGPRGVRILCAVVYNCVSQGSIRVGARFEAILPADGCATDAPAARAGTGGHA